MRKRGSSEGSEIRCFVARHGLAASESGVLCWQFVRSLQMTGVVMFGM